MGTVGNGTEATGLSVSLRDIYLAKRAIAPWVPRTPLVRSGFLSEHTGANVYLKLETCHEMRAFKIRGATNFLGRLAPDERARGVVTVSTGNHGRAVALAAKRLGVRAVVCMSELVPQNKRKAIAELGAEVRIVGHSQDEAEVEAKRLVEAEGLVPVHPFDHPDVIAGQGTIGLELLEDLGHIDTLVCGLSGGGLLSGIAVALKAAEPSTRIVGVSMRRGPAMYLSVQAGKPVPVEEEPTLADSLGGGIGLDNAYTFELVRALVDDYVLVSEDEIAQGMRLLFKNDGVIAEGGGAVSAAAIGAGLAGTLKGNVVCMVSGGNIDMDRFAEIIAAPATNS